MGSNILMKNNSVRLRILHVINGLGFGGAETWLLEIVKLNQGYHQIDFLLTGGIRQALDDSFEKHGCRLYYCKYSRKNIFSFIRSFRTIANKENYDVVHDHEDFVAGLHWLFLIGKWPGVRIMHAHNSTVYIENYLLTGKRNFFYKMGRKMVALFSTKISGTSDQLMKELGYDSANYQKKRIEPLYCGINPELFMYNEEKRKTLRAEFGFSANDKIIIFIGRIGLVDTIYKNPKNPLFAFELARLVCTQHENVRFLFLGDKGKLGSELEAIAKQEGLADKILFLDKRNDVPDLLSASDLMLFTSTTEPFGLTLIEAQFNALPIIASKAVIDEVIQFSELFTFLSLNDDMQLWIQKVEELLKHPLDRLEFTLRNKERILQSKFSIQQSFERLNHHYSMVV